MVTVFPAKEMGAEVCVDVAFAVTVVEGEAVGFTGEEAGGWEVGVGVGVALGAQANITREVRQSRQNSTDNPLFIDAPPVVFSISSSFG